MISVKVLYISYDGAGDNLGRSQIIPYIIGLSGRNIKFTLFTFEKKDTYSNKELMESLRSEMKANNIDWLYVRYKKPFLSAYNWIYCFIACARRVIRDEIQVIHGRSFIGAAIGSCLKKVFRVKFILDMRGFWPEERVEAGLWHKNGILYKIAKVIEKFVICSADEIVVLTQKAKEEILCLSYLGDKKDDITVIPTCVDINKFKSGSRVSHEKHRASQPENKFTISYIGSLSTWYMPSEIFKFFEAARRLIRDCRMMILTKETGYLKKIMPKADGSISILNAEHSLVPGYLSSSDAGLAFYKPGYSRKACCPTKLGEYLALGLPVIINSGIGDCDEIILKERVGVVIHEFSPKEYEKGIGELKSLLSEGDVLKERCIKAAEKYFSLELGVERYYRIYEKLTKQH